MARHSASAGPPDRTAALLCSPLLHIQALLVIAVILGGGGAAYGMHSLTIQLASLLVLAINGPLVASFVRMAPLGLKILVIATMLVPLLQVVPLPPAIWQVLPGREVVLASHGLAGLGDDQWFPASMDRARTLGSLASLIPPATIIVIGAMLPAKERVALGWTLVVAAMAAMLFGVIQLQTGNQAGLLYPIDARPYVLYATFANRNSTGLFLAIAALLALALARPEKPRELLATAILVPLLAIGTILTLSRSSMVILCVPLAFLLFRLVAHGMRNRAQIGRVLGTAGMAIALMGVIVTGAVAYSALQGGRVADSIGRFDDLVTDRPEMWEDSLYAAGQYWPLGAGMGTFDEVFQLHESLEHISQRRAGRAHSDWIELAMEAGLFGIALASAWLVWAAVSGWRHLRRGPSWAGAGAAGGIACIALQSLLDYPLRNQTMLCVAGVLVVLAVIGHRREAGT